MAPESFGPTGRGRPALAALPLPSVVLPCPLRATRESAGRTGLEAPRTRLRHQGDDSMKDPPLPIPNREVKLHRADGTAKAGE